MNSLAKRLDALEARIGRRGATWSERTPWEQRLARWKEANAQDLELDFSSGDIVTLEELRRRDPERAQALEARRRQACESMDLLGETTQADADGPSI